jgi:endoglycosylceramidase
MINEPWAGDIYRYPELLLPGFADKMNLEPLYNNLNRAIRKIDQNHIIFYEPITWDVVPTGTPYNSLKFIIF